MLNLVLSLVCILKVEWENHGKCLMNIHIHLSRTSTVLQDGLGLGPDPFWTVGPGITAFFVSLLGPGHQPLFKPGTRGTLRGA